MKKTIFLISAFMLFLCFFETAGIFSEELKILSEKSKPCISEKSELYIPDKNKPYIPDIETFMQIGYAASPDISRDGKTVFFISNMSGVSQLYRLTDKGWPYQLTVFPDGIDFYSLSPDSKKAIIGASRGGDEQSQLYLLETENGRIYPLTSKPEVKYGSPVWSRDGEKIFFHSNEANGRDFYIYCLNLKTGEYELILEKEGYNTVEDVSACERLLLTVTFSSNVNSDLFLIDLDKKKVTHLTPHTGKALYFSPRFTPDGNRIYFLTNDSKEGMLKLAWIDLEDRKLHFLEDKTSWEIEEFAISRDGKYLAWVVNEDGYGKLKLFDLEASRPLPVPPLYDGIVSKLSFSEAKSLIFCYNSPTRTSDVWLWQWEDSLLSKMTHSIYAGIDREIFVEPKLIKYRSFDGRLIPAFLYLPPVRTGEKIPFIIHIHGGPESQFRPSFIRHFQYLLLNGYGILAPNIRGSSGYGKEFMALDDYRKRKDAVQDVKYAALWLINNGYTDSDLLAIKGASYGGYMVLAAITEYPELFSASIDVVGIVNFVSFLEKTKPYRRHFREKEYGPLSDISFLTEISPLTHVEKIKAPLLVIHGKNDPRVPVYEAYQLIDAIKARGGVVESLIFPDEGHGISKRPNILVMYRKIVDFLDKHLLKKE